MKDSKLIIIAGMSGCGKSTTAQQLSKQYAQNAVKYLWLHEEVHNHPIRKGEFRAGPLDTEEGMSANIADMYERWERLADEIEQSDCVYIMEGCLYQMISRYFFTANYPFEKITEFYDRIMEIIAKLNPTVVFLYRSDVKASYQQAFAVRGERWQSIILDPQDGYFKEHPYTGEESTYAMYEHYQQVANAMFDRYYGHKIKFDTLEGKWSDYHQELCGYLGLSYFPQRTPPQVVEPERYCGRYVVDLDGGQGIITIKVVDCALYCQVSWWSNMRLIYLGDDEFEVLSFPIGLKFNLNGPRKSVDVKGVYGWGISGKTLVAKE